ncbi:MAG: LLM class flavin-dependent oxidoreductase [Actinobacteria bacterium]|nr:LLM class flavin-dependent oxidoreductase [Actinomycetota bacterium]
MTGLLFGLDVSTSAAPGTDPVGDARAAEVLGFDFVSASDHPCGNHPSRETWTMLTWIAAATSRIRVATRVLGVPNRSPAIVAKMAETLDRFSGGRLILGLGGGASDDEFRAFGLDVRSPRDKIIGLEEAVRISRGLWSERSFTFQGRLYENVGAEIEPKPDHPIPIWLGTFGPRALDLTGRLADGWIPSLDYAPPERIPAMRDRIFAAAREVSREPEEITCAYNVEVNVSERPDPRPSVVSGPPDAVAQRLLEFLELGFTALNFMPVGEDKSEQTELLAHDVIPAVRDA